MENNEVDGEEAKTTLKAREPEINDALFQFVVSTLDDRQGSFPVTVSCGGVLIVGQLISRTEFLARGAEQLLEGIGDDALRPEIEEKTKSMFQKITAVMKENEAQRPAHPEDPQKRLHRHFHMKDVKIMQGGTVVSQTLTWWRGRTAAVDGWRFGRMF